MPFVINVNDLVDNTVLDYLLYADDVKLIAPPPENKQLTSNAHWPLVPNGQRTGS